MDRREALADLHAALGHRPLSRLWAKLEILLGLAAAGCGLLLAHAVAPRPAGEGNCLWAAAGLAHSVLGGSLAMAGHRSHLYQSNNELTAYLAWTIRECRPGGGDGRTSAPGGKAG